MALGPRLEIRQSQSLTLTPQLMQSIRLLQLSHLEINVFVTEELERNPLLDRDESTETDGPPLETATASETNSEDVVQNSTHMSSATDIAGNLDTEVDNVFPEQVAQDSVRASTLSKGPGQGLDQGAFAPGESAPDIDQYVPTQLTLTDHLAEQAMLLVDDPVDRMIARYLIDSLDDTGYLGTDCATIAAQLGAETNRVEAVLTKLQACDPVGVFARSVSECLALQLRDKDRLDPLMARMLEHLDLIASHDLDNLARTIGASQEDLQEMLVELRALDPKPGRAFDGAPMHAIVPDVFVTQRPDESWAIELNSDVLPRVLVNRTYHAQVTKKARSKDEKSFLTDCLQTANWLTKSLDQRAQTILKVSTEIVRQQDAFFVHGVTQLKPMTLRMIADEIDMHESTVSRVTSNKYISTPRGLFELKYFFTTALASSSGNADHSSEAVRHFIRQLIDEESAQKILSDDIIAERLHSEHSIEVARRTVAKYREGMNIPSSVVRRRQKKALAKAS